MNVQFVPITKTEQNHFNVVIDNVKVGTFSWQLQITREGPKKMAIVHSRHGGSPLLCGNEEQAVKWLLKKEDEAGPRAERADDGML